MDTKTKSDGCVCAAHQQPQCAHYRMGKCAQIPYGTAHDPADQRKHEAVIAAEMRFLSDNNVKLQTLDEAVRALESDPEKQLGLLIIASVLAVRRFCTGKAIFDRGRRLRVIKSVVAQTDSKLRAYVGQSMNPGDPGPTGG